MMEKIEKKVNAGPIGLVGFGLATLLLNLVNVGVLNQTSVIVGLGLFLGGLIQFIAGIIELKNKNNFGGTAFTVFGGFWFSLVYIWQNQTGAMAPDNISMGFYLLAWALVGGFLFVASLKHNTVTKIIFGLLTLLFILLAIADFMGGQGIITIIAGIVGITNSLFALYSAAGQIIHEEYGKKILPLF